MPDLLKKKAFLISLILVVLLVAIGIYTNTDSYKFDSVKDSGDYWAVWRYMAENPGSDRAGDAQEVALALLNAAERGQRVFGLIYNKGRAIMDEDYERFAYAKPGEEPTTSSLIGGAGLPKYSWGIWEECKLYLLVRHKSKFDEIDDAGKTEDLIKESFDTIIKSYDSMEEFSLLRFGYLVDMMNESSVELNVEAAKSLESLLSEYIANLDVTPLNKRSEISWEWINRAVESYPQKANLISLLAGKELERMRYIHSDASLKTNEKINNLIKENKELLRIDSTYNWTPLSFGLIEYEDRIEALEKVKEEHEVADATLAEAKEALSNVSGEFVDILGKIEGNYYEGIIGGQRRIVLMMIDRELTQTGEHYFYITRISSKSGVINKYTNMPMPLYSQYVGDYDVLKKDYRVQIDKTENLKKKVESAEMYIEEMEPIMLDLFGRVIDR